MANWEVLKIRVQKKLFFTTTQEGKISCPILVNDIIVIF